MGGGSSLDTTIKSKASDSDVVHKSGNEVIDGDKIFNGFYTYFGESSTYDTWRMNKENNIFRFFTRDKDTHTQIRGFCYDVDNMSLQPFISDGNLGTSTNKWKTINGVSPSALSLPNLSEAIDISASLDTSQSSENTYIPPSDGYISILGRSASTCGIVIKTDSLFASTSYSVFDFGNTDKVSCCMCPVFKNQTVTIWLKSVTSLDSAKFFPCQGNV